MTRPNGQARAIGDYALIGDGRSAALIARDGTLEWLCWPRFDSPTWFAAMLDVERGGHFGLRPRADFTSNRRYIGDTNVLETTFQTATGVLRLTDCMAIDGEREKRRALWPQHEIVRRLECVTGEVEIEIDYRPRPNYGDLVPRLRSRASLGLYCEFRDQVLVLRSDVPILPSSELGVAQGHARLRQGERAYLSLVFSEREPAALPATGVRIDGRIARSIEWWNAWCAQCTYQGPYRAAVIRSALVLKALAFAPSGAMVAAPTTSLPEWIGGIRNWDYRFCWLRDASLTVQALHDLGYATEATAFLSWLIHTTRMTWPELRVLYDVYGEHPPQEYELSRFTGFGGSRPVRIGNAAADQLQLDVYGEVIDAAYQLVSRGERIDRDTGHMLVGFGETVCRQWREPDSGIWEIRAGARHHTYSKVMCWVALDRLLRLHEAGMLRAPAARFAAQRAELQGQIERRGFNPRLQSYVTVFGGDEVDASLLQLGRHGYVDASDPRMRGTRDLILRRLGSRDLLYRYHTSDGLPSGEHPFGIASFWAVASMADAGDEVAAKARFEQLLQHANDVGLYAEEIDANSGAPIGNFPQAFTHVGLVDAALSLESAHKQRDDHASARQGLPARAQSAASR